jgi:CDP-diacylglycerol---glycerol-3-phosphate 3-phosphatidyltransferase
LAYSLWILWRGLPLNHRPGERDLLPTLGPGTRLTLLRALCLALIAGFLCAPWPPGGLAWLIVLLYTLASIADYLDGYAARVRNHATRLGERLDMEYDGLGVLTVTLLAVSFGQLPWWYLGLGLARYAFVFGLWQRRRRGLPVYEIPPSAHRRLFAGFQMGFLSAVLWPIVPADGATLAGALFAAPMALGFGRDWLAASGRLDPAHPAYKRVQRGLVRLTRYWLPPLWRVLLVVGMVGVLTAVSPWYQPDPWRQLTLAWGVPPLLGGGIALLLGLIAVSGTLMGGLGWLGRLGAILLVFPLGFDVAARGLLWSNGLAVACAVCLMLLGAGPVSLWRPEERFLLRRMGGAPDAH